MRWLAVICAGAGWLCAQEETGTLSPELTLLSKIKSHAVENLRHQPNYTCVETVERSRRSPATKKLQLVDTLRLEVALVDGKEMFGWPGAKKFEDSDLTKMVTEGAIGNGDFALFAKSIFSGQGARFKYHGEEPLGDRASVRFDYRVPLMMSGYTLHIGKLEAIVGYHGSIYADPKSLDVQRLEVVADDIPIVLGLADATDRMDYTRVAIADGQFLLPEASELTLTGVDGSESRNRVRFASCRQFAGESVLTFDEAPRSAESPKAVAQIELPSHTVIVLSLLDDLKTKSAAVGDQIRARLQNDLKHNGQILFAKGSTATGRVSHLELHQEYIVVGIEFSEIESGEARARLKLVLEDVGGRKLFEAAPQTTRPPDPKPGEGILTLRSDRSMLGRGTLLFWRTS